MEFAVPPRLTVAAQEFSFGPMSSPSDPTPYDQIPYPSYTHRHSHPDVLATQAILHGLNPAPVGACRVLELGCGNGSNLIPMAYSLPGSHFTGADLSVPAVERGNEDLRDLGLTNIELRHANILEIDASWGEFDYIIAHGVFSWVPPEVRDKILAICHEHLASQGVAFISYLALPGAHVRAMLRDMMLYHAGDTRDAAALLAAAKEVASFVASTAPAGDPAQRALQGEAARFLDAMPNYLLHDDLAEWSAPYYFTQFARMAAEHGLQYLAEADSTEMADLHLPPPVRENLARIAPGRLYREQYLDFIKARRFRQTLLCRVEATVSEFSGVKGVAQLWVATPAKGPEGAIDLSPGVEVAFASPRGPKLDTALPSGKAALDMLINAWPLRLPFNEVLAGVHAQLISAGLHELASGNLAAGLAGFLNHLHSVGLVEFYSEPSRHCKTISARPLASAVARWQAARGNLITTLRHVGLTFHDEITITLIPLLDGTRTLKEITAAMVSGTNAPGADPAAEHAEMEAIVTERLERLATNGILLG